jgi:hypothetical protein
MFSGWARKLYGRPPVRPGKSMRRKAASLSTFCKRQTEEFFGDLVPARHLAKPKGGRDRVFTVPVVFWTFLCQILANGSCRSGVASVQTLQSKLGEALCSSSDAAFCRARVRFPIRALIAIHRHLVAALSPARVPRTFVVDGTTVSMPDTEANQACWPQSGSQKEGLGFPIMRIVGLFDLASGAWIAMARGTLKGSKKGSERTLWLRLWRHIKAGDTVVADAGFCCWFTLALLDRMGVRVVIRNHGCRKAAKHSTRIGKNGRLERWRKPSNKPEWLDAKTYGELPDSMAVRILTVEAPPQSGFRTTKIELTTTVTDSDDLGDGEMSALYFRRWKVELFIDDLKTSLGMDVLRTKSPAMIYRELLMHVISYNLLRAVIAQADEPDRVSFKGSLDRINKWIPVISGTGSRKERGRMIEDMLETTAEDLVIERPGRREPRLVKRRPKPFGLMTKPRGEGMEIAHRSRYKKPLS